MLSGIFNFVIQSAKVIKIHMPWWKVLTVISYWTHDMCIYFALVALKWTDVSQVKVSVVLYSLIGLWCLGSLFSYQLLPCLAFQRWIQLKSSSDVCQNLVLPRGCMPKLILLRYVLRRDWCKYSIYFCGICLNYLIGSTSWLSLR